MKISLQVRIFSLLILLLSAGIGYSFWQTSHSLNSQIGTNRVVQDMIRAVFELDIITNEFINSKSDRALSQWNMRHASLEMLFAQAREIITYQDDESSLNKITRSEVHMEEQFFMFQEHILLPTGKISEIAKKKQDHIKSQIRVATQEMLSEAARMSRRSLSRLADAEEQLELLSIILISILGSVALISVILIHRTVLKPVVDLQKRAATLAAGDYEARISVKGNNEISALARSYNTLASEIQKKISSITEKSERLNESQEQLIALNSNLQLMVEEQTADLRASEVKQRTILETMVDAVISLDKDYTIMGINPAASDVFGYTESDVVGRNIEMLIVLNTGLDGETLDHQELEGNHKQGHRFPIELTLTKMDIDDVTMYTGIARDITERKRLDRIKNEFVSTVSHELRTPLTAIRGSLGLVVNGVTGELPDKAQELLVLANNNTERLLHLINDILDIQKIEAGKLEFHYQNVDLMGIIEKSVVDNKGYAEVYNVKIDICHSVDNVIIHIDPLRLAQILANLLSNAAKFSHKGGVVTINAVIEQGFVKVSVTDRGEGIPLDFQSKLFDKFVQNDSSNTRQKGGTGLGLSITKFMVEKMEGQIDFSSTEGQGSTFNIYLPLLVQGRIAQ